MKRQIKKKTLILVMALVLTCCCLIGTTYAWLVDKDTTTTTFTVGNIDISMYEPAATNRRIVPGGTYTEDPRAIVRANSEDCWLFIKFNKSDNFDTFLEFTIADGWTELTEGSGIYYRFVEMSDEDQTFEILKGNVVTAKGTSTKAQYDTVNSNNYPSFSITAYGVQRAGFDTPGAAWEIAKTLD